MIVALVIFGLGLLAASHKTKPKTETRQTIITAVSPSATPLAVSQTTTVLKLLDATTKKPLAGQSIAIIGQSECVAASACPTPSPLILMADNEGRISLPNETVRAKPKLYAAGYKLDSYFSFLDSQRPTLLTVYKPVEGTKATYDIDNEAVTIGLYPTK